MPFESFSPEEEAQLIKQRRDQENISQVREDFPTFSALMPRVAMGAARGAGMGEQLAAGGADILSGAGRTASAYAGLMGDLFSNAKEAVGLAEKGEAPNFEQIGRKFLDAMQTPEGKGMIDSILKDPRTAVGLATGGSLLNMAKTGLKGAMMAGGIEGLTTGVTGQMANIGEDKDLSAGEFATDVGVNVALPGVGAGAKWLGGGMKSTAEKIMESVIKPSKKLTQGTGKTFDVKKIFELGLDSKKGINQLKRNIDREMRSVSQEYKTALESLPADSKINLQKSLDNAKLKLSEEISSGLHADDYQGIEKGFKYWQDYIDNVVKPETSVKEALSVRAGAGKLSKFDRTDPNAVKGLDKVSREFRDQINNELQVFPKIRKIDEYKSDLIPIQKAVDEAIPRLNKNFIMSLNDNPALLTALLGGSIGGVVGGGAGALGLGLAGLGVTRALKSPSVASGLYGAGERAVGLSGIMNSNPYLMRTVPGLARIPLQQQLGNE